MNLQQTVSKILNKEVTEQEAMEFALKQYGTLCAFNKPKEPRVYVIDVSDLEKGFNEMTDEEFINESEKQGTAYSLEGFQNAFNKEELNISNQVIKIIL